MFGRYHTPSARPSLLMFRTNSPISGISSFIVLYRVLAVILSLWGRDHNCMYSYRVSTVDVPQFSFASDARAPWQQPRCDYLDCHEEWWGSVPRTVVVFSWALDEGGAPGTCSSRKHLPSVLEVQRGAVLSHQCHTPQWTSPSRNTV